jgi:hypothetical protein
VSRLGIIVPFRKRWHHLYQFIPHYKRLFPDAHICIIEQAGDAPFNRAKLLNVGYLAYRDKFDYFAAHDVDMLVERNGRFYKEFPEHPTQLATHVQQFHYKMPFPEYFGGVTLFNNEIFEEIGGYSNNFWGYGGEDNEMYYRIEALAIKIVYRECYYRSLHHPPSHPTGVDWAKMEQAKKPRSDDDGVGATNYIVEKEYLYNSVPILQVKI